MERLELKYRDAVQAGRTLKDVLNRKYSEIIRDATIQRFEYTFEALWKFLKSYLNESEGIIANSPKKCFREIFSLGFLNEEETAGCLEMTDSRNETSHTYRKEVAVAIFNSVKDKYMDLIEKILNRVGDKIGAGENDD